MYSQYFPPKPTWTPDQMVDLSEKVMIVTGGNTGIGFETCKVLFFTCKTLNFSDAVPKMKTQALHHLYFPFFKCFSFLAINFTWSESLSRCAYT